MMTSGIACAQTPSQYIGGTFHPIAGDAIRSINPAAPDEVVWSGTPQLSHVDDAVAAAKAAAPGWASTPWEERVAFMRRWQEVTTRHADRMANLIMREMGKTMGECQFEAKALAGKVDITLGDHSMDRVRSYQVPVNDTRVGNCRYKPHGVMAVIGPFNFPAHLPNGHFVPALLMGNTIVFKPSEKAAAVGQFLAEMMDEVGLPPGVFNVVQGATDIAARLVAHDDLNGILFTGSWPVGRRILEANLDHPGRMIALELGGNNPAVVMPDAHLKQAVVECVRASFATTGQRCTCTRRIIVHRDIADTFIPLLCKMTSTLLVGAGDANEPVFMGPLVTEESRQAVLDFQAELVSRGGRPLVESVKLDRDGFFLSPGIVEVDRFELEHDCETFGPLVQLSVVDSLDDAIEQANATRYGLAASIFTQCEETWNRFFTEATAGCINWNTGTAGASSQLPFGGWGHSGNHRPAGAFSIEYCGYPIANMVEQGDGVAVPTGLLWPEKD